MLSERAIPTHTRTSDGASKVVFAGSRSNDGFFDADPSLADRYEIRGELASGGMGRILEAWDLRHDRVLAVKVLRRSAPRAIDRFAREARITARLEHPGIVPVHDAGRLPSGEPFYAMTLVRGRSLRDAIGDGATMRERLALLPHVLAIADALAYAHEARVVHRDLKPSNVIVGRFGETVVVDWGLAKDLTAPEHDDALVEQDLAAASEGALTLAGAAIGTPAYMPPEQARGEPVDERADVYAIGAILYEVIAGRAPYVNATIGGVLAAPPAALESLAPEAPADLLAIVSKAMARESARRYPSARDLAEDLRRFSTGRLVSAHTYGLGALLRRWVVRHRLPLGVAAAMLTALVAFGAVSVRRVVRERERADAAARVAEHERARAVARRDAAEHLVAYMTSDLRGRLRFLGREDVLAGVDDTVSAYLHSTTSVQISDDTSTSSFR